MRRSAVALALFAVAGCGGSDTPREEPESAPTTDLRIVVWPAGRGGTSVEARLTCNPPGGDHPSAALACDVLERESSALDPVPSDAICTQEFGGPEEADVTGMVAGERIRARLSKRNGCEIARWERLAPLLDLASPL